MDTDNSVGKGGGWMEEGKAGEVGDICNSNNNETYIFFKKVLNT